MNYFVHQFLNICCICSISRWSYFLLVKLETFTLIRGGGGGRDSETLTLFMTRIFLKVAHSELLCI